MISIDTSNYWISIPIVISIKCYTCNRGCCQLDVLVVEDMNISLIYCSKR